MSRFEKMIENLKKNNEVPEKVRVQFQNTLENLPDHKIEIHWKQFATVAAMLIMISGVVLMGGTALASKIPFLGKIFAEVENLHFFSGDYDDKTQILEQTESTVAECEGIKITASEIYSDGFSVYVTAEIYVEAGGLLNIHGEIERKTMYLMGSYQIAEDDTVYDMINDNLYGTVMDDHTFIGMTKLDLEDVHVEDGSLNWKLTTIGYDDVNLSTEPGISHRYEGEWNLVLPFHIDSENKKTIEVDYSENGYTLEKVVITPYQVATFIESPKTENMVYIAVANQDGKLLKWQRGTKISTFSVEKLQIDSLNIYVFNNEDTWFEIQKRGELEINDMAGAKLFTEISIK